MRFQVLFFLLVVYLVAWVGANDDKDKDKDKDYDKNNHDSHDNHDNHDSHPKVVKGKVFDRIISIWLENVDFEDAFADPNLKSIAKKGLSLTNFFAMTHPSEPNYVAGVGAEFFGIDSDDLLNLPPNVSSVVDLLEDKGISWAEYQEDMPSTGFTGFQFLNQKTGANDYVRKHNPLIIYESVTSNSRRISNIKNFTLFEQDLAHDAIPQWVFITPNMTNDGHDTDITFAGQWSKSFLDPLLDDRRFNGDDTLIVLTFDESGVATPHSNRIYTILLGNALPKNLQGKTDGGFYTHYSTIATVEANWGLHTLGRWDVGANVFDFVGQKTGDKVRTTDLNKVFLNASYPGIFSSTKLAKQPIPNTNLVVNGRTVLPAIQKQWASQVRCTGYHGQLVPPSLLTPPVLPHGC